MRLATLSLVLLAAPAWAGHVTLNGVNIDGVREQTFKNCDVTIDADGNVHVSSKAYSVAAKGGAVVLKPVAPSSPPPAPAAAPAAPPPPARNPYGDAPKKPLAAQGGSQMQKVAPAPGPPPAPAPKVSLLAKRYYVVAQTSRPGVVQYDVDVYVNGAWVRRLRGQEPQEVFEISSNLTPGKNLVQLSAVKNLGGAPRASNSASDAMDVVVGEGESSGGATLEVKRILGRLKKTAADVGNDGAEITIDAK